MTEHGHQSLEEDAFLFCFFFFVFFETAHTEIAQNVMELLCDKQKVAT